MPLKRKIIRWNGRRSDSVTPAVVSRWRLTLLEALDLVIGERGAVSLQFALEPHPRLFVIAVITAGRRRGGGRAVVRLETCRRRDGNDVKIVHVKHVKRSVLVVVACRCYGIPKLPIEEWAPAGRQSNDA